MSLSRRHFLGTCAATMLVARYGFADSMTSKTLRVALISDTHTNREIEGDASLYRVRFDAVIEDVNAQKVDLILLGGDLTEGGKPETIADFKGHSLQYFTTHYDLVKRQAEARAKAKAKSAGVVTKDTEWHGDEFVKQSDALARN